MPTNKLYPLNKTTVKDLHLTYPFTSSSHVLFRIWVSEALVSLGGNFLSALTAVKFLTRVIPVLELLKRIPWEEVETNFKM